MRFILYHLITQSQITKMKEHICIVQLNIRYVHSSETSTQFRNQPFSQLPLFQQRYMPCNQYNKKITTFGGYHLLFIFPLAWCKETALERADF